MLQSTSELRAARSWPARYGVVIATVALALLLALLLRPALEQSVFPLFLAAVVFSAWYGGLGPGLLATALSAVASAYYFISPQIAVTSRETFVRLGVFALTALLINSLSEARRRSEATLREQRQRFAVTLTSIGDAVIATDMHGRVTFMNPVAEALTGWTLAQAEGRELAAVFQVVDEATRQPVENPIERVLRGEAAIGLTNHTALIAADGTIRPIDDSGAPIRDKNGNVIGVVLVFRDISARRQAEQERARMAAIVESSNDAVIGKGLDGIVQSWNISAERMYGYTAEEVVGKSITILAPPDRPDEIPQIMRRLARGERIEAYETIRVRKDGTWIPVLLTISPIRDAEGTIIGASTIARDISERKQAERERARLLAREQAARARAEAAAGRLAFLAEASRVLASSLDYPTRLASIARLAVPRIADWCILDLLTEDGTLQQVAAAHVDSAKVEQARELRRRYPPNRNAPTGVYHVARTGEPEFYPQITDEVLATRTQDAEHLAILRELGLTSVIIVPLIAGGRTLGTLTLVSAESRHPYDEDDLTLAEDLAGRAASAIENARLYREVQEQRERFAVTLASIGDAVIATDAHSRVTFMNAIAEALTGWTLAQAQGKDLTEVFQIVNEYTREAVESPAERVLREGVIVGLANHTLLVAQDGTERPIDDSGAPIRNAAGELIGTVLVFRDVSERRQTEIRLQETNQMLRTIVDASPLSIMVLDQKGKVELWNPAAARIFGWDADEVLGRPLPSIPAGRRAEFRANLARTLQNNAITDQETRGQRKDGAQIDIDLWMAPLRDLEGAPDRLVTVIADITQRKRAEESLRFLATASTTLVSSLDYQATLANITRLIVPALADYCAIHLVEDDGRVIPVAALHVDPPKQELLWEELRRYHPHPGAPTPAAQVLQTGQAQLGSAITREMLPTITQNEEQLWFAQALGPQSYLAVPLRARGRVFGVISLFASESEVGRHYGPDDLALVEELARRAALAVDNARLYLEAQRAIHVRDQFLSIAAHELKTPLTSLLGQAQLLQRRALRENLLHKRDQRTVQVITEQATRLNRMISALLDISRIQTGQLSIERTPLDISGLARRVVEEVQPILQQHTVICVAQAGLIVAGDEVRLEQVLQNLIQNAIKYSPTGGTISVRTEQRAAFACVEVSDQGIGIPTEALPQLFQRFYRAANADEQHISGMGVGLYVVSEIVALHNGKVSVESVEGQGSTFTVWLPLASDTPIPQALSSMTSESR